MPELDSHHPTSSHPTPLTTPFSPWHALGPSSLYPTYSALMATSHLRLLKVVCRTSSPEEAAKQWETLFGVERDGSGRALHFLNARLNFVEGKDEGIESLTVGVLGRENLGGILGRAQERGILDKENDGSIEIVGVKWYLELVEGVRKTKL